MKGKYRDEESKQSLVCLFVPFMPTEQVNEEIFSEFINPYQIFPCGTCRQQKHTAAKYFGVRDCDCSFPCIFFQDSTLQTWLFYC